MSIHSVNNSLASIHSGLLPEKKNDAKGTDDANQVDSSQAKRFGDESSTALDRIKNLPEIRSDVVAAARERLESGFYGSRDAAMQTAKTILQ